MSRRQGTKLIDIQTMPVDQVMSLVMDKPIWLAASIIRMRLAA